MTQRTGNCDQDDVNIKLICLLYKIKESLNVVFTIIARFPILNFCAFLLVSNLLFKPNIIFFVSRRKALVFFWQHQGYIFFNIYLILTQWVFVRFNILFWRQFITNILQAILLLVISTFPCNQQHFDPFHLTNNNWGQDFLFIACSLPVQY